MPKNGEGKIKWMETLKERTQPELLISLSYILVCSLHFKKNDILENGKLKSGAIPTIFR